MKPLSFFKEKSETLLKKVIEIELKKTEFVANNSIETIFNTETTNQKNELNEIKFQIKLMFTEFDNGKIFIDKLESEKDFTYHSKNMIYMNQAFIDELKNILNLFIVFLEEYRDIK